MNSYHRRATESLVRILEKIADSVDELGDTTASIPEVLSIYRAVMESSDGVGEYDVEASLRDVDPKVIKKVAEEADARFAEVDMERPHRAWDGTRDEPEDEYDLIGTKRERPLGKHVLLADIDAIPTRGLNGLRKKGIVETFQLTHMTRDQLMNIEGVGEGTVSAIEGWMGEHGMALSG